MIITQLGLLLTTMRYSRRAFEDIERSTSKYMGLAFAPLFRDAPKFGQPPLFNGALKVYVVNINDLTEPPAGGILEGLLGGAGRLVGGLIGGIAGGTISGVLFPWVISSLARITANIDSIAARIERIVSHFQAKPKDLKDKAGALSPEESSTSLISGLPGLTALLDDVTLLLRAANGEKMAEGKAEPSKGVDQILHVLKEVSGIIDGLILLLPIVNGFLASLIMRLDSLKLGIVDFLEWLVRNVLLMRGLILVVIQETIAEAARLAQKLLQIASALVKDELTTAFGIVEKLLELVLTVLKWVGSGLKGIMTDLMEWLRTGLGEFLIFLGNTPIMQFLFHIVDILPNILPALVKLVNDSSLSDDEMTALKGAAAKPLSFTIPSITGGSTPSGVISPFPDLEKHKTADFNKGVTDKLGVIEKNANDFVTKLDPLKKGITDTPVDSGVIAVAKAYEEWLEKGGLATLLTNITAHLQRDSTLPTMAKDAAQPETPRSTVEIDKVEIVIEPPDATVTPTSTPGVDKKLSEPHAWMWSPDHPVTGEALRRGLVFA